MTKKGLQQRRKTPIMTPTSEVDDEDNDMTPHDDNYHGDNDHNAASIVWSSFR